VVGARIPAKAFPISIIININGTLLRTEITVDWWLVSLVGTSPVVGRPNYKYSVPSARLARPTCNG